MGGKGAKERRRMERANNNSNLSGIDNGTPKAYKKKSVSPKFKKPKISKATKQPTPRKIKKPKHLKRKLEHAQDDVIRDQLLQEILKLEEAKNCISEQRLKKQKTAKVSPDPFRENCNEAKEKEAETGDEVEKVEKSVALTGKLITKNTRESAEDSDSEEEIEQVRRQRGRRRRGRQDTSKVTQERKNEDYHLVLPEKSASEDDQEVELQPNTLEPVVNKNDARRCIGRKPVTDFVIGQRYPGKVVYIKPFGVFIDIMCHSEAFCHVSRLQDGFVESPDDVVKVGDKVMARVVETDRKLKHITVSLQSDERLEDERASMEARRERASKREEKKSAKKKVQERSMGHRIVSAQTTNRCQSDIAEGRNEESNLGSGNDLVDTEGIYLKGESEMTPTELKRARKLARRVKRRTQKDETGIAA